VSPCARPNSAEHQKIRCAWRDDRQKIKQINLTLSELNATAKHQAKLTRPHCVPWRSLPPQYQNIATVARETPNTGTGNHTPMPVCNNAMMAPNAAPKQNANNVGSANGLRGHDCTQRDYASAAATIQRKNDSGCERPR